MKYHFKGSEFQYLKANSVVYIVKLWSKVGDSAAIRGIDIWTRTVFEPVTSDPVISTICDVHFQLKLERYLLF